MEDVDVNHQLIPFAYPSNTTGAEEKNYDQD